MISVCLATYNGDKYIKAQLDSILKQLSFNDEIIVSDNNSTDTTLAIISSYKDERIKVLHNSCATNNKFYNIVNNFYNAIIHANGEYIFLSDQDDIWLDGKVECIKEDLQHCKCVITNYKIIDAFGNVINDRKFEFSPIKNTLYAFIKFPFLGCTMAFKRRFFEEYCNPFPPKIILHDIWIGLTAFCNKGLYYDNRVLLAYRKHNNNVTTASKGKSSNTMIFKLQYRMYIYYSVIARKITFLLRKI